MWKTCDGGKQCPYQPDGKHPNGKSWIGLVINVTAKETRDLACCSFTNIILSKFGA